MIDPAEGLLRRFRTVNLFPEYRERWSVPAAREAAEALSLAPVTVLLGRRVATAFGLGRIRYFEWIIRDGAELVVAPHPSGLSRLLNDPAVRITMGGTLREAMRRAAR